MNTRQSYVGYHQLDNCKYLVCLKYGSLVFKKNIMCLERWSLKTIADYSRKLMVDAIQCIMFHSNFSSFPNSSCNFSKISPQYV